MKKRLMLMLAVLLVAQPFGSRRALAMAETPEKVAMLGAETVLPICDRALVAAMNGRNGLEVLDAETKALPKPQADQVQLVCRVYLLGAVALLKHMQEAQEAATAKASQRSI